MGGRFGAAALGGARGGRRGGAQGTMMAPESSHASRSSSLVKRRDQRRPDPVFKQGRQLVAKAGLRSQARRRGDDQRPIFGGNPDIGREFVT